MTGIDFTTSSSAPRIIAQHLTKNCGSGNSLYENPNCSYTITWSTFLTRYPNNAFDVYPTDISKFLFNASN